MPVPLSAPRLDHEPPSHLATRVMVWPPALVKFPVAYKSEPSKARALTGWLLVGPFKPAPSADQELPFQCAIFSAGTPPAVVNFPAAYRSSPINCSVATVSLTPPTPPPTGDQLLPSHTARLKTGVGPALVKLPPI